MDQDFDDHPDWGRFLVPPGAKIQPVGDPTRWGSQALTALRIPAVTGDTYSTQVIQAATQDGYSRSWALAGSLSLVSGLWVTGAVGVDVALQIQMGVGQAQVLHEIALFSPVPAGGLCETQYFPNGGPYVAYTSPPLGPAGTIDRTRAFAAIGALVGATINIRVKYTVAAAAPVGAFPCQSQLNIVLTPFAAGEGL